MKRCSDYVGNVHSVETFGTFDGPGVRYVLFLQGCPFQCKYCHNRDTWEPGIGTPKTVAEVLNDYDIYREFYRRGGLTVSGGEPLYQREFITCLFKEAKRKKIHTTLDTSGGTFKMERADDFLELIKYTDLVMLDIKHINDEAHKWLTGISNVEVLNFATFLDKHNINMYIRHVLLPEINDSPTYLKNLRKFLDTLSNVLKIEVLPYHDKGVIKWGELGLEYELKHIRIPTQEDVKKAEKILMEGYRFKKAPTNTNVDY